MRHPTITNSLKINRERKQPHRMTGETIVREFKKTGLPNAGKAREN